MRVLVGYCLIALSVQIPSPVIKERSPRSIQGLPPEVRQDLAKRSCVIPKYRGGGEEAYVMGRFRSSTSGDYAIVCHNPSRKVQDVLVYSISDGGVWIGEDIERGTFDPSPGADKCETELSVASPATIRAYTRAFAPEELKLVSRLDHDGVDVAICEKASIVHYFNKGKWLRYQGAD
jgi:hypothetical protein